MMTILHLRSSEFFGGPERAILGQCKYYKKARLICASFVRPGSTSEFLIRCSETGVKTVTIPERFTGDFGVRRKLVEMIRKEKIDLIISHDYKANFFGRSAAKICGVKQAAHFRGRTTEDRKVWLYNWIDDRVLRKLEHIIVVSEKSKESIVRLGIQQDRVIVVPNGFDMSKSIAERAPIVDSSRPIRIVAAGRLSSEKGYDILMDALALVSKQAPAFLVDIYGEGPEEQRLKQKVIELKLTDKVNFPGFVSDLLPVFRKADLLVLPSRSEGMPNVVLEAWSQHVAVVAAAVGGLPEMIRHGENGWLADPEDPADLARNIEAAISDSSKMHYYGQMGYETLVERYSFQRQALLLDHVYRQILGNM